MLFSVIIPVYNVQQYLTECINSIICQDFNDFEVILVDDGSTDKSATICDEYARKDSRVIVIHQVNAGVSVARNEGLKHAQGDYVIFLDSDDYICTPKFLNKLFLKTQNHPDVIFYGYKKFFESNKTFGKDVCDYPNIKKEENSLKIIELLLKTDMYDGCAWTKAIKRTFLQENNICFEKGMTSEDVDWFLQVVVCANKYDTVNQTFVAYRQREGSLSHASAMQLKGIKDNLFILQKWTTIAKRKGQEKEKKELLMAILARYYANLLILYARTSKEEKNAYYQELYSFKYLLKYSKTKRARIMKSFNLIFGLRCTLFVLYILNKLRRRT